MKHTQGKWIEHNGGIESSTGRTVATTNVYYDSNKIKETNEENKANAVLIASAPELLEALKGLLMWTKTTALYHLKDSELLPKGLERWKELVSKAEGED